MITKKTLEWKGTPYSYVVYDPESDPKQTETDYTIFFQKDRELTDRLNAGPERVPSDKPLSQLLSPLGPCTLHLGYTCDDYASWQGSKQLEATLANGNQAFALLEYMLNNFSNQKELQQLAEPQSLDNILFAKSMTLQSPYVLELTTGAEHPQLAWREMYHIFVVEHTSR